MTEREGHSFSQRVEEAAGNFQEFWVATVQAREYDLMTQYILNRTDSGKAAVVSEILIGGKVLAMNVRRGAAAATGLIVGLAVGGIAPELVQVLAPTMVTTSLISLGVNVGIDRLMERELKK